MTDLSQESPLWREWAESRHSVQQMREELDRLRAELEIARKDAERYRRLRAAGIFGNDSPISIDRAIDNARGGK